MLNLVKQPYQPLPLLSISAEAEDHRNELVQSALAIKSVATAAENELARNIAVELRKYVAEADAARLSLTRPVDEAKAGLIAMVKDHCTPLKSELERLERLATVFIKAEQARIAAEEKARLDLAAEARTDQDFNSVMAEHIVAESRARGQQMRQKLCWEVTDIMALVKARPELVKMEAKGIAIQALCVPEAPVPGLRLWWEEKVSFTTR